MPKRIAQVAKKTAEPKTVDPYKAKLAERIATAFKTYNADAARGSELSQDDFADAVSKRLGLGGDAAYSQTAVSRWMNTKNPTSPPPRTLQAIAAVLNADLMWLTYGASED